MADKLSIYNAALLRLGARKLSSLSENRPSRHALDSVWDGGLPKRILADGQWNDSIRSIESIHDPDYSTPFGFQYAHNKPADWVRTVALCGDEGYSRPLTDREAIDEHEFWYSDYNVLYIKYVSSNVDYGGDISLWPEPKVEYAECELAYRSCRAITGSNSLTDELRVDAERARRKAKSFDQMNQPVKVNPAGSWVRSRFGGSRYIGSGGGSIVLATSTTSSDIIATPQSAFSDGFSDGFA